MMHAAAHGAVWVGDVSPDRMAFDAARNAAAKAAIDSGADGVVWIDSDMILPSNAITRLVDYGLDFVSGVYFQRVAPHWPLCSNFNNTLNTFQWMLKWPRDVIFPTDGVGFGCCYTSVDLLNRISAQSNFKKDTWFEYRRCSTCEDNFSEDFTFCLRAAKVGSQPFVDTGLLLGHLGEPEVITVDHFLRVNPNSGGTAVQYTNTSSTSQE
jgi:hypothetical protein